MWYVLYALAQASTDSVTTGPKHLPAWQEPADPTQGTHGQQPLHFNPQSGTHALTRFGALVRAARVGGGLSSPTALPMGPTDKWHSTSPSWAPSNRIWVSKAWHRSRVCSQQHLKPPTRPWLFWYVCACMCMYINVFVCIYMYLKYMCPGPSHCMYVRVYECIWMYMYVSTVSVCMYMQYIHIHTHTKTLGQSFKAVFKTVFKVVRCMYVFVSICIACMSHV